MSNDLVIIEEGIMRAYPKFDLARNRVTIFKGKEFDINDFTCLQMLTNHDPGAVAMVTIDGQDLWIYYDNGAPKRVVGIEERKVLWEKYTEFMIAVRRKMLPVTNPEHPDYVEPKLIKESKVIVIS
jgi:hypothetical protein